MPKRRFAPKTPDDSTIPRGPAKAYLNRPAPKKRAKPTGPVQRVKTPKVKNSGAWTPVLNLLPVNFSLEMAEEADRRASEPDWTELDCAVALGCTVSELANMRRAGTGPEFTETRDGIRYSLAAITNHLIANITNITGGK
ncbi:hypothetical protein [Thioalkalivibrio sp. ALMg3]|uniref:hypothetical protein n=1 Tax=Thioalkalivibrio sp. ALMg3 TaxID=1158163 RepID=UPI00036DB5F8|nr:hypothetical protein [Thioalkalivibrio sp. ALMg3]